MSPEPDKKIGPEQWKTLPKSHQQLPILRINKDFGNKRVVKPTHSVFGSRFDGFSPSGQCTQNNNYSPRQWESGWNQGPQQLEWLSDEKQDPIFSFFSQFMSRKTDQIFWEFYQVTFSPLSIEIILSSPSICTDF